MNRSDPSAARTLLEQCGLEASEETDQAAVGRAAEVVAAVDGYRGSAGRDLGAVFDEHIADEFVLLDVDATMETMTADPYLDHVPVMTGGVGRDEVRAFYADHFIGKWPADTTITTVSRTIGERQVVEEMVMAFTHDVVMDALFPGVAPTGRRVELPVVVVMGFEGDRVSHEHIYWDQATALVQMGLLDPEGLPVAGVDQARKLLDKHLPTNALMATGASR